MGTRLRIAAVVAMIHVDDIDDHKGSVDQSIREGGSAHVTRTSFFIVIR